MQAAYTSLVLDSSGTPHVSYQNLTSNSALSIADYSGSSWTLTTVGNPPMSANNQAFGAALARDQSNNLYSTSMQSSPKNIHLIKRVGAAWTAASNLPNVGAGTGQTCVFVSSPSVHMAYFDSGLKFLSSNNGGASVGSPTTIDAGAGAGQYCSIVSTGTAGIHVSYYDSTAGDLKYAFFNGTGWTASSIDTAGTVGSFTSIALDASSRPHISYIDQTNAKVKHAFLNAGSWTTEIVDASSGSFTSIAVHGQNPQIAYFSPALGALKWAGWNGVSWSTETADSTGGQFASMALDSSGNARIASVHGTTQVRYSARGAAAPCDPITSAGSGSWSAGGTWSSGSAPTACAAVTIASGHVVILDAPSAEASTITLNGTLSFSRASNAALALSGGDLRVSPGGSLDIGTEASPIPAAFTASLSLATGIAGGAYGLVIEDGGNFSARGSARSPYGFSVAALSAGAVSLQVAASSAAGWSVGDLISIGPVDGQGAATVEERAVTSITGTDPLTVGWSGGLVSARAPTANAPIVVANLTRNVVIASSGTSVTASANGAGGDNAYVRSLASHATGFYAAYAEFDRLGADRAGRQGLAFDGTAAAGTVSSCALLSGFRGLAVSSASALTLAGNVYAKNLDAGLLIEAGGQHALSHSLAFGNGRAGFNLSNSSGSTVSWIRSYANGGDGLALGSGARDLAISSSAFHNNAGHGLSIAGATSVNVMVQAGALYGNGGDGVNVADAPDASFSENNIFSNMGAGVKVCGAGSRGHYVLGGSLGYDSAGTSKANANGEFRSCAGGGGGIGAQLNQANINPANGGIVATTLCAGDAVSSYNENGVAGSAHVFGDYQVTAATFTLTHVKRTNAPAYTGPTTVKGTGHTLTAIVVNDAAVNELFKIVSAGGASWTVTGQKSGQVGTITCGASASCAFSVAQLSFSLVTGATIRTGDRIHLVTHQPSNDANAGKGLKAGPACPTFNGGFTKVTVPPGSGFDLQGIAGTPTTMDTLDGTGSFSFVSSGVFTMAHSSISRADEHGIQLSGVGPVTLASTSFDNTGGGNVSGCTLLTMNSLSVTATLPALYFGNGSVCPNPHSILVRGDTSNLNMTIESPTGPLSGDDYISDPSGKARTNGGGPYVPSAGSPAIVAVSSWSATALWTANSNSTGTLYSAQASTAANFSGTVLSSATKSLQGTILGLNPNATYYLQVNASTTAGSSAYRSLGSTRTLAAVPVAAAYSGVGLTQLAANWTADGNPAGTAYTAILSTGASPAVNGFAGNQSSTTLNVSALFSGLAVGTTYFVDVRAANGAGIPTAYASLSSTMTLTSAPTAAPFTGVGANALTANWGANGNPAGTSYTVILSTSASPSVNGAAGNLSSTTLNASAAFTGLNANATYYAEVRAGAGAFTSLSSTITLAAAPAAAPFSGAAMAQLTANWTANGNPAGTTYAVVLSSGASPRANGFAGNQSSTTLNVFAAFSGLAPNATYFADVLAVSFGGAPTEAVSLSSASTLAAVPGAAAYSGVSGAGLTAAWTANGNPPGTGYLVILSSGAAPSTNGFAGNQSSATFSLSAVFGGLTANTTYHAEVRAANAAGIATAFASLSTTVTLTVPPSAAPFSGVGTNEATANWGANGNPAGTLYTAILSSGASPGTNGFAGNQSSATLNVFTVFSGLELNTTYYAEVRAGAGAFTGLSSTVTLAAAPAGAAFSGVGTAQLTANWTAGGNPAGTSYRVTVSSGASPAANGYAGNQSSITLNTSAVFSGLAQNSVYFSEVSALNHGGTPTAPASLGSTATLAAAPGAAAFTAVTGAGLTAHWTAAGNPAGTSYLAILSSGASPSVNGFAGNQSSTTFNLAAPFAGLTANTTYHVEVRAANSGGTPTAFTSLSSTVTLPAAPLAAAYSGAGTSSLTANWTANGNGAGAMYTAILSTGASPATNGFAGNQSSATLNLSASFAGLSLNTTYFAEVKATGSGGSASAYAALGAGVTLAAPPSAAAPGGIGAAQVTLSWGANGDPAGTLYEAFLSTDPAFGASASSATRGVSATFAGLAGNTTYYSRVRAISHGGVETALTELAAALTLPAAPVAAAYVPAAYQVLTAWTANGNATGTSYTVIFSSGVSPSTNGLGDNVSSTTLNLAALFAGLGPNTTYYADVRAMGFAGALSAYTPLGPTMTSPVSPLPPSAGQGILTVGTGTITGSWGASAGNTHYTMAASTSSDASGQPGALAATSTGTLAQGELFGLTPNTTYQCFASACNAISCSTYTALGSTITLAAAPSFAGAVAQAAQLTLSWNANGNPAGTPYTLVFSSGPSPRTNGFAGNSTSVTASTYAVVAGLAPNTSYYAEVKAANGAGLDTAYASLPSAATLALPPAAAAYTGVGTAQLTANWTANGNPAGTVYSAVLSTGASPATNGFAGNQSSATVGLAASFAGLAVNATYYAEVRAVSSAGIATAYTPLSATVTLAAVPAAAAYTGVSTAQVTANWGANGNPAGTEYHIVLSTGASPSTNGFAGNQRSTTRGASATFAGLAPGATQYAEIRAHNFAGVATAYAGLPVIVTLLAPPGAGAYAGVGISQLTVNWSANGNPAGTSYNVVLSTAAAPETNGFSANQTSATLNDSASFSGLDPNTTYFAAVQAGAGAFLSLSSTVTLAAAPVGAAVVSVATSSLSASWGAAGNPAWTAYFFQASTAADFSGAAFSSRTLAAAAVVPGLAPNTTYFLRVRAENAAGEPTAFVPGGSTATLAAVPSVLAPSSRSATTLTFQWNASGNPGDTVYTAQLSTAADFSGTTASDATAALQSSFSSLANDTTYYARVRAAGRGGVLTAFSATAATMTVAAAPGAPVLSAYATSSSTIRWSWTAGAGGAPAAYRLFASSGAAISPALAAGATFYLETGLSVNVLYYRYLRASNEAGQAFSSTDSVSIPISVDVLAGAASSGTVVDPLTGNPTLEIPAGATADTMRWFVSVAPVSQPLVDVTPQLIVDANSRLGASVRGSSLSVREYLVTINDVRFTGNFLQPVTVIVPYLDADNDGIVDGTTPPVSVDSLKLYTLNEGAGVWELMAASTIDTVNKTVRGQVPHLSIYTALGTGTASAGPAASDVSGVRVYPNPWRPGSSGDYDAPAVVFDQMPAQATIRLYTLSGTLVRTIEKSDGSSQLQWDGSDSDGTRVASGVYYFIVTSPSGGKKKGRLAVIR